MEQILSGIISGKELDKECRKRSVKYIYTKVQESELQSYLDQGWEKYRRPSKNYNRLRKLKDIGPRFEDEVWCTFKRLGFNEMNKQNFVVPRFGSEITKQIDVFMRDEQCICIVECKSAEIPHTKKYLDKDIDQINGIRHELELSIFSHYKKNGIKSKFKVAWILTLKNIDINENDQERAKKSNVYILDENNVDYYCELSKHFGRSAKYQFLGDMFPGREIPDLIEPLPAIKGTMAKETFYSFVIEPEKLLKIGYIAHRAKSNEESITTYQRMAKKSRLKRIAAYIKNKNGIFPTNIVLNIETDRPLRFDVAAGMSGRNAVLGKLYLPNKYKTAWIIDGQHRLFAYSDLEESRTATLPVIAFENLDTNIQAKLFVDINGEQVRVSKNLLNDLWATIHWNSQNPDEQLKAIISRLVKVLNEHQNSPLRDRIIKIGGRKSQTRNITPTAIHDEIKKRNLIGSINSKKAKIIEPGPLFLEDKENTLVRSRDILSGYFNNYIKNETIKKQWDIGSGAGGFICTNSGIVVLIRILSAILVHLEYNEQLHVRTIKTSDLIEKISKYQEPVVMFFSTASPKIIQEFRMQHGEGGYTACTMFLLNEIHKQNCSFNPPGLDQWIKSQNTQNNPKAYELISELEKAIMEYVVKKLKEKFGPDKSQWWRNGIPEKVRDPAAKRADFQGDYDHYENYVDFINWKEIIEDNYDLFGPNFQSSP